nr:hypothetical protein [bacterium]
TEKCDAAPSGCAAQGEGFCLWALDSLAKVHPVTGNVYEASPQGYALAAQNHLQAYPGNLFRDGAVRLEGVPGEHIVFQLVVENKGGQPLALSCHIQGQTPLDITLSRCWYVPVEGVWHPEVAVPLSPDGGFEVPSLDNAIDGQRYQAIVIDAILPKQAGDYRAAVCIGEGKGQVTLPLCVAVADIALPRPDFVYELNGYTPPPHFMDTCLEDQGYAALYQAYQRVADEHGAYIDTVAYNQSGHALPGYAPDIKMVNGLPEVVDWSAWDRHFACLLNGEYRKGGKGRPVPCVYLPVHENWPMRLKDYYIPQVSTLRYPDLVNQIKDQSHGIEHDFKPGYREGIVHMLVQFIRHIDAIGAKDTRFFFFLNNKYYFKNRNRWLEEQRRQPPPQDGVSWWLLDEPVTRDDWRALRYYADMLREARRIAGVGPDHNLRFRIDVSRYYGMLDSMDGVLDDAVLNNRMFLYRTDLLRQRRAAFGERYWVYGSLGGIGSSMQDSFLNVLDVYMRGADGFLPWDNFARDDAYTSAQETATLYPGGRFGVNRPLPSLRLKAVAGAMALVGLLDAYRKRHGLSDVQLQDFVSGFIRMRPVSHIRYFEDAGMVSFNQVSPADVARLRRYLLRALAGQHTA